MKQSESDGVLPGVWQGPQLFSGSNRKTMFVYNTLAQVVLWFLSQCLHVFLHLFYFSFIYLLTLTSQPKHPELKIFDSVIGNEQIQEQSHDKAVRKNHRNHGHVSSSSWAQDPAWGVWMKSSSPVVYIAPYLQPLRYRRFSDESRGRSKAAVFSSAGGRASPGSRALCRHVFRQSW